MKHLFEKSPRVASDAHREGPVARLMEQRTAGLLPSDAFLWSALASIGASLALKIFKKDGTANSIGQRAPTFLILGLHNKLVVRHLSSRG